MEDLSSIIKMRLNTNNLEGQELERVKKIRELCTAMYEICKKMKEAKEKGKTTDDVKKEAEKLGLSDTELETLVTTGNRS